MKWMSILIFCCGLFATSALAQSRQDSLWKVWNDDSKADTIRLKAIQGIIWPMLKVDLDSAGILAQHQLNFAEEKNQK